MAETDYATLIKNTDGWQKIRMAVEADKVPQSVAAFLPLAAQAYFVADYAKLLLCDTKAWSDGKHPDLIFCGTQEKAPSIEECRTLNEELALHPVSAKRRLAIIWAADKLSLEAENSLLKLTEEPPANACILFVAEENKLLSTIKSRVWSLSIDFPAAALEAIKPPQNALEWATWLAKTSSDKKGGADAVYLELQGWINYYIQQKKFEKASNADILIKMSKMKNMSLSMVQDLAYTVLQEDVACEKIFSNLR